MGDQAWLFDATEQRRLDLSQWYTPPDLAAKIWQFADGARARTILEPSAGHGSLIMPSAPAHVAKWTAHDVDPNNVAFLRAAFPGLDVRPLDWIDAPDPGRFDLAIMNPPYEGDQDVEHVLKAIRHCDRVVALLRSAFEHSGSRWEAFWRWVTCSRKVTLAGRPRFGGAGSPVSDFKVFEFVGGVRSIPREHGDPVACIECTWP